jgi:hypothetical protein
MLSRIAKFFNGSHLDDLTNPGYKTVKLLVDEGYGTITVHRQFKYVDTWTEWDGNHPCPIVGTIVPHEVRFRNGLVYEGQTPHSWEWYHDQTTPSTDIVAYRVLSEILH